MIVHRRPQLNRHRTLFAASSDKSHVFASVTKRASVRRASAALTTSGYIYWQSGARTVIQVSKMPSWVLNCINCGKNFTYSTIRKAALVDFYFEAKPEFPLGGSELECPKCWTIATYQRIDLRYQA